MSPIPHPGWGRGPSALNVNSIQPRRLLVCQLGNGPCTGNSSSTGNGSSSGKGGR
jgi:hypothetical protein